MKRTICVTVSLMLCFIHINSQANNIKNAFIVGGKPSNFEINFDGDQGIKTLNDLKGSWIILDFWNRYCVTCIKSFSKMNAINKNLKKNVKLIMIGELDRDNQVRKIYERFRQKLGLEMNVVFDSSLFQKFNISACPYIVVIDTVGIVRAVTYSIEQKDIEDFTNGTTPQLAKALNADELAFRYTKFDPEKPYLLNGNGGEDSFFIFRSVLSKWNPEIPQVMDKYVNSKNASMIQFTGISLSNLYQVAYGDTISDNPQLGKNNYGQWWYEPIWMVTDSAKFLPDYKSGKNIYCYSIINKSASANVESLKMAMKNDLKSYFGFEVKTEERNMPYWKLIADDRAKVKLTSKTSLPNITGDYQTYVKLEKQPMSELVNLLWIYHQRFPPFIDETGIKQNIDLELNAILTDLSDVKNALNKVGLDIVPGIKRMSVIVISPKYESN